MRAYLRSLRDDGVTVISGFHSPLEQECLRILLRSPHPVVWCLARGQYRFICDADLSMPIEEIVKFVPPALSGFDVAIGSREAPGAVRYNEPAYRHWGGRGINLIIRLLILPGLQDTQCGFKCFSAEASQRLFKLQTLPGWSFDIELLYLARRAKMRIREIPIHWYFGEDSKVSAVRDALNMIRDIFRIHGNARRGTYG